MRILVIGGSGFIGPFLVRDLLAAGHEVGVLHRGIRETPKGAVPIVADRNALRDARQQVFGFAPEVVVDLILSSERQASDLLQALHGVDCRIVAASSIDVYRASSVLHGLDTGPLQDVPLTEDSELRSQPPYGVEVLRGLKQLMPWVDEGYDKVAVESALRSAPEFRPTILRLPMIYGPGDHLHRLYPQLKRMDEQRPAILMSDDVAQWCGPRGYVENVAAALVLGCLDPRAAGRTYNVATFSISEEEWTRRIAEQTGWSGEIVVLPREHMPAHLLLPGNYAQHWTASSQRIRAELGYSEPIDMEESLRRTIEWERANRPEDFNAAQFDYAAEDAALARGVAGRPTN